MVLPGSKEQQNNSLFPFQLSVKKTEEVTIVKKKPAHSPTLLFSLSLLALALVTLLSACEPQSLVGGPHGEGTGNVQNPNVGTAPGTTAVVTTTVPSSSLPEEPPVTEPPPTEEPPTPLFYHPLSGLPCTEAEAVKRPFAFCVRQASGGILSLADVVVEAPTEGRATRLSLIGTSLASQLPSLSVASTRPYLAALSHDFYAISVYNGTSDNGHAATDFLYDTLDLSECGAIGEERILIERTQEAGYDTEVAGGKILLPFRFCEVGESFTPKTPSSYVSLPFADGIATTFSYDAARQCYTMRTGAALLQGGDTLPCFQNLLILYHNATRRITKDGVELVLDTEEGGYGYYLTRGGVIPIFWRRDPITSSLRFTDEDGGLLVLNRGKTYIGMSTYDLREQLVLN